VAAAGEALRLASFFSGIGGFEHALGVAPVFQVETDPYCRRVLERRFPGVARHDDIRTLDASGIPEADLWVGGFPCQDISPAGKGAGIHGERSGLWHDWSRLIKARRPAWILIENHPALRRRGLDVVLSDLAAAGYDARWLRLSAWDVGAWHWRERLWIAAGPRGTWGGAPGLYSSWVGMLPRDGVMVDGHVYPREPVTSGKPPSDVPRLLPTASASSYGSNRGGGAGRVGPDRPRLDQLARRAALPTATDAKASGGRKGSPNAHPGTSLTDAVCFGGYAGSRACLPMAAARDHKSGTGADHGDHAPPLSSAMGGLLNPAWEEPFMGFPVGWTSADDESTPHALDLPAQWLDGGSWLLESPAPTIEPRSVTSRRQRVHALGNAVVPAVVARAADTLLTPHGAHPWRTN